MKKDLGRINGKTQLIGLFATPIGHSLSPAMHNLAFKKLGLNYAYLAYGNFSEAFQCGLNRYRSGGPAGTDQRHFFACDIDAVFF